MQTQANKRKRVLVEPGIWRRGNRWYIRPYINGEQVERSYPSLGEARLALATAKVNPARVASSPQVTLRAYAAEWLATYRGRTGAGLEPETRESYRRDLERQIIPRLRGGRIKLRDITPQHLRRLVADMEADGLRPSSIARYVAPLRALLATAAEDGVITRNPWTRIPVKRRQDESQRRHLTDEEVARLLGSAGEDVALALRLLAATGIRRGELLALTWQDVQPRRIRVAHALRGTRRKGRKRGGAYWTVIGADLGRALAQVKAQRGAAEADTVFVNPATGAAWNPDRFSYRVAKAAKAAGVKATSHTLRHSLGSRMAREGHNAKAIQVALGQSDLATTMSYYIHLEPDELPELAELLPEQD